MNILPYLQEVTGITMTTFQEMSVPLLRYKVGNVARDTNIEAIQDCQDQLWPARCAQAQICHYFIRVCAVIFKSAKQNKKPQCN